MSKYAESNEIIAKGIVAMAFRNGPLEDYHASGQSIGNDEIKALMKHGVDTVFGLLELRDTNNDAFLRLVAHEYDWYAREWDAASAEHVTFVASHFQDA